MLSLKLFPLPRGKEAGVQFQSEKSDRVPCCARMSCVLDRWKGVRLKRSCTQQGCDKGPKLGGAIDLVRIRGGLDRIATSGAPQRTRMKWDLHIDINKGLSRVVSAFCMV